MTERDKWADWLVRRRQEGLDDRRIAQMHAWLRRLAARVVKNAKVRAGHRVLDVGAGTGLLTHEASRRLNGSGHVVACDVSHDALRACREEAGENVGLVVGDAGRLPFADETFDAVMTRSVLIYLDDKPAGVRELRRVLKPGGRASVFEPINDVWRVRMARLRAAGRYDAFRPVHDRLFEYYLSSPSATFLGWDERDLVGWFEDAGFSQIELAYEQSSTRPDKPKRVTDKMRDDLRARWRIAPNPHDPSFEELVHQLAGDEADEFLTAFLEFELANPAPTSEGRAFVTARR